MDAPAQSTSNLDLHEMGVGGGDLRQPESMFPGEDGCFIEPVVNILVVTWEFLKDHLMAFIYAVFSLWFVCA